MLAKVQSIVIPRSVTDETNFVVISLIWIWNACEPVFPMILNWKCSWFAFIELYANHSCSFYVSGVRLMNMLSKFIPQE